MKKRIFAYILIFTMLLSLVACAPTAKPTESPTDKNDKQVTALPAIVTGNTVYYGRYPQSDLGVVQPAGSEGVDWITATDKRDEKVHYYAIEPIVWWVLSNEDGRLLLLSEKALDAHEYHLTNAPMDEWEDEESTWENSTMRKWLNGDEGIYGDSGFINRAFSEEEQVAIMDTEVLNKVIKAEGIRGGNDTTDKIFLLSVAEVTTNAYGFAQDVEDSETRRAETTAYARNTGTGRVGALSFWWLRSPGYSIHDAAIVLLNGYVSEYGEAIWAFRNFVRPALILDLNVLDSEQVDFSFDSESSFLPPAPEKPILSELPEEESLEFIASSGIEIPVELNHEETIGEFVRELILRAEKMPYTPRPFDARAPVYLAESIRKAVNEYYGIECDNYDIVWDPSFALSFEERAEGQQILSELSDDECMEFLEEHGVTLLKAQGGEYYGEFIKDLVTRI